MFNPLFYIPADIISPYLLKRYSFYRTNLIVFGEGITESLRLTEKLIFGLLVNDFDFLMQVIFLYNIKFNKHIRF